MRMTYLVDGEPPPTTDVWQPETIGHDTLRSSLRAAMGRATAPLRGTPYGDPAACWDCGLADEWLLPGTYRCLWCQELRALRPPPNPGRRVRS